LGEGSNDDQKDAVNAVHVPESSKVSLLPSSNDDDSEEDDAQENVNDSENYFHYFNIFT